MLQPSVNGVYISPLTSSIIHLKDCTGGRIAMQFDTASQNNIISNISTVYEERVRMTRTCPLSLPCPIMKQNLYYYKDVLKFARSMNIEADSDYSLFGCYDHSKSNLACRLSIDEIEKIIHDDVGSDTKRKNSEKKRKDSKTPICPVCKTSLCISNSGNIYPCEGWQSLSLGNIKNQSLRKIWEESPMVQYLRELTYGHFLKCNSCQDKKYCTPCLIMNANEDSSGNLSNINPLICEIARIKKDVLSKSNDKEINKYKV